MSYQLIINDDQLADYCSKIENSSAIALDTEFIRTQTFYPHLGLLQIFDGEHAALIDPIAINDWKDFLIILSNPKIEKYFHSCSEDIEVFLHYFGIVPTPIIDSQILASFLDNPLSCGYANLVKKYLEIELDKSETRTDWLKRPLTERQCEYAINDVLYLFPLINILKSQLSANNYLQAAYQECQMAVMRKCEVMDPKDAYLNIKNNWQLKGKSLGRLYKLANWRYKLAKEQDIALNFVIHEEVLFKVARYSPTSLAELNKLGMKGKEIRLYGQTILAILSESIPDIPPVFKVSSYPNYKYISDKLKEAARELAKQTGLNPDLLISRRLINQYVKWQTNKNDDKPEILIGWRKALFEKYCFDIDDA
ncbi:MULTISPECIES: ribonuclease D [unclassified Gilliamella]|uniref:ribonuclease D n=1 Tax=unclassified Gilliamella TaxID=2685620 RepID=UPI0013280265|nr:MULTISPECIES: ribonuclease D [unclassified Gilliamella]MWN31106.1 ribonuclease D [Gilliamella sp. Pra-s60]MWP28329.1 ribonuclease D [Gilliamella sp. Pra-s54]